ncbi:MAG: hypothetical protein WA874_09920 [Chryseosolibacter sp.]
MEIHMKYICSALVSLSMLASVEAMSQAKVRKMSTVINHPSLNVYAPYVSADANAIVFLTDNAEDNALTPFFSLRENTADWKEPQVLPKYINTRLNFLRGYGLSADGGTLYFSTMKSPGVGGFDICSSDWKGAWANPVNLGAPINSRAHEACPSVTPDGKTMYFMRCEKMDQIRADRCRIFRVDKKTNGLWGEPAELSETINTGNSQSPRIMADGETLIFSSDQMGSSKGGMDLYMSKFRDGNWTAPVPMSFANTEKDDQYVSVTGLGRYLLRDSPGPRKSELVEYLIPDALRPKGMMKIDGTVVDAQGQPVQAYISLVDIATGKRVYNGRPNRDGTFLLYAMEGSRYDLSIDPEHGNKTYFSKVFDLTTDRIPQVEKVHAVLKTVLPDDELILSGINFRESTGEIDLATSERELKRFARVVTSNPDLKFEVHVVFEGYKEDSIQSDPDLTEMRVDTVGWKYIDIDTLGQLYERDTVSTKVIYHNDRTVAQVQSIIAYLISSGASEQNVVGFANIIPATMPENKKTLVKARVIKM